MMICTFVRTCSVVVLLAVNPAAGIAQDAPLLPTFAEETATAGIASVFSGEWEFMVGGGVAVFDCNADRKPDMLIAGGTSPATFYPLAGRLQPWFAVAALLLTMAALWIGQEQWDEAPPAARTADRNSRKGAVSPSME